MDNFFVIDFTRKRRFLLIGIIGLFLAGFFLLQSNNVFLGANKSDEA